MALVLVDGVVGLAPLKKTFLRGVGVVALVLVDGVVDGDTGLLRGAAARVLVDRLHLRGNLIY